MEEPLLGAAEQVLCVGTGRPGNGFAWRSLITQLLLRYGLNGLDFDLVQVRWIA